MSSSARLSGVASALVLLWYCTRQVLLLLMQLYTRKVPVRVPHGLRPLVSVFELLGGFPWWKWKTTHGEFKWANFKKKKNKERKPPRTTNTYSSTRIKQKCKQRMYSSTRIKKKCKQQIRRWFIHARSGHTGKLATTTRPMSSYWILRSIWEMSGLLLGREGSGGM